MKVYTLLSAAMLFTLFWVGCGDRLPTTPNNNGQDIIRPRPNTKALIPLKTGNSWSYQSINVRKDSNSHVVRIDSAVTIASKKWFFLSYHDQYAEGVIAPLYNMDTGTIWGFDGYSSAVAIPHFLLKYPAKVGDTFESLDKEWILASTDTVITVPAGKFQCYLYHPVQRNPSNQSHPFSNDNLFICPGIGIIRGDDFDAYQSERYGITFDTPWAQTSLVEYYVE